MLINYLCSWEKEKEKTWSGTGYSLYKALKKQCEVNDVNISLNTYDKILLKISRVKLKNHKILFDQSFNLLEQKLKCKKVTRALKLNNKFPILQLEDCQSTYQNTYLYQDLSIDSLYFIKDKYPELFEYSGFQNDSEKAFELRRKYQERVYRNAKGIFTMSKWLRDNLINYSGIDSKKVHYVGGGINLDLSLIQKLKKNNSRILFVGRDFERKGGDLVCKAFEILKKSYLPNAELYIAGPKERPIRNMVEGIHFLGELSKTELSYYFNLCDVFCMPSRFEAYGLVFIEALVYGLPCIGRDVFAMNEFISDDETGYLVRDDNIEILAEKMFYLLQNDRIKENVIKKHKYYVETYSWDAVAKRILNYIKTT